MMFLQKRNPLQNQQLYRSNVFALLKKSPVFSWFLSFQDLRLPSFHIFSLHQVMNNMKWLENLVFHISHAPTLALPFLSKHNTLLNVFRATKPALLFWQI